MAGVAVFEVQPEREGGEADEDMAVAVGDGDIKACR